MSSSRDTPIDHKEWVTYLGGQVGGRVSITAFSNDDNGLQIPIFKSVNGEGVVAATIGLMEYDQSRDPGVVLRTEVIMDKRGDDERIANIVSTIAFYIMNEGWGVAPGVVFRGMLDTHIPGTGLPHVMFVVPFQWQGISEVVLATRAIHPLMAVPISESECRLVQGTGTGKSLEDLWIRQSTDVFDWDRQSAA